MLLIHHFYFVWTEYSNKCHIIIQIYIYCKYRKTIWTNLSNSNSSRPVLQIPQCIRQTSLNAPLRTEMCPSPLWTVHRGMQDVAPPSLGAPLVVNANKQRVLTPGHQGWNDLHSLCRIGMKYYLLNDNDNDNNNNNNNNDDDDNDNDDNNNKNNLSSMKVFEFQLQFHWSLFPRVQFIISQHWFRQWLDTEQARNHYPNQCWPNSPTHI